MIAQVAVSAKDAFDALFAATSVEHRPTCIGAVPGLWFQYTIPAS